MQELRLVAVSEDGSYLVLATAGRGTRFTLPVDDRLRAAVRGHFSRLGQYEIEVESPLRPKEIQARIRAGETAEEIAETAGIPVERVRWFEGPVLQEREYMAQQAQRVTIRRQGDSAPAPALGEIVEERLGKRGIDLEEVEWDSRKCEDSTWRVRLSFSYDGRPYAAEWAYDPRRRHISAVNEEAARLSSLDLDQPVDDTVTPFLPRRAMKVVTEPVREEPRRPAPAPREEPPAAEEPAVVREVPRAEIPRPAARAPEPSREVASPREASPREAAPSREAASAPSRESALSREPAPREEDEPQYEGEPREAAFSHETMAPAEETPAREAAAPREEASPRPREAEEPREQPVAKPAPPPAAAERPAPAPRPARSEPARPAAKREPAGRKPVPQKPAEQKPVPAKPAAQKPSQPKPAQQKPVERPAETEQPAAAAAAGGGGKAATPPPAQEKRPAARKKSRGKRASVPSWDEIMFGARRPE
jgi:hypothetical protein